MSFGIAVLGTAAVLAGPATAQPGRFSKTACAKLPEPVRAYLRADTGWSIVDMENLDPEDRELWRKHRNGQCPGMAAVRLDDAGKTSYAVTLLRARTGQILQKMIVLRPAGAEFRAVTLASPKAYGPVHVIWRMPPGTYKDFNTGQKVRLRQDGIGFESISASVELFYPDGDRFRSIMTTD